VLHPLYVYLRYSYILCLYLFIINLPFLVNKVSYIMRIRGQCVVRIRRCVTTLSVSRIRDRSEFRFRENSQFLTFFKFVKIRRVGVVPRCDTNLTIG